MGALMMIKKPISRPECVFADRISSHDEVNFKLGEREAQEGDGGSFLQENYRNQVYGNRQQGHKEVQELSTG